MVKPGGLVACAVVFALACGRSESSAEPRQGGPASVPAQPASRGLNEAKPSEGAVGSQQPEPAVATGGQAKVDTDSFTLELDSPNEVAVGKPGTIRLKLTPKGVYKLNKEFPTSLTVTPPAGVNVDKPTQKIADAESFEEKQATFAVTFTAQSAGDKAFAAKFKFAVCTDATCEPKKQDFAWSVAAK